VYREKEACEEQLKSREKGSKIASRVSVRLYWAVCCGVCCIFDMSTLVSLPLVSCVTGRVCNVCVHDESCLPYNACSLAEHLLCMFLVPLSVSVSRSPSVALGFVFVRLSLCLLSCLSLLPKLSCSCCCSVGCCWYRDQYSMRCMIVEHCNVHLATICLVVICTQSLS
jgi:hypothetical protein